MSKRSSSSATRSASALARKSALVGPAADDGLELGLVRRQARRAAIALEVSTFRVDQNRTIARTADRDYFADAAQRALTVVGQDHDYRCRPAIRQKDPPNSPAQHVERLLGVEADELLTAREHAELVHRRDGGCSTSRQSTPRSSSAAASNRPLSSAPTMATSRARAPSAARFSATFAAPPGRLSVAPARTTGTGASGDSRAASPNQYSSSIASPATTMLSAEKSGIESVTVA